MKKLYNLIEYDMFGKQPTWYIGGQAFYGTIFGLIISIFALLTICVCSLYFIIEMFDTKNVNSYTSVDNPAEPLSIQLTSDKFYLALALEDPKTYNFIFDESIYTITAEYRVATREQNGTISWIEEPVELAPCEIEKFPKNYQTIFSTRSVNHMYCVKFLNYTIEGTFLHDKYSFIKFDFYQCVNTTKNGNKCKPKDQIDYYLNGTFATVEFTDISLDPSNYSNPDSPKLGELYSTVGNNFYREMHLFLKEVKFESDRGLVFSSIQSQKYIQLDYLSDMFSFKSQSNFCSLTLKLSNRIDVYKRTYTKFQTTLANIGGIVKAVTIIGQVLTYFFIQTKYELDLINKIFFINSGENKYQLSTQNATKLPGDSNSNLPIMDNSNNKCIKNFKNNSPFNNNYMKKSGDNLPQINKMQNLTKFQTSSSCRSDQKTQATSDTNVPINLLSLSVPEIFFSKICAKFYKSRPNIELLTKGSQLIQTKLDIIYLIREFFNLTRLESLIFSEDQLLLFNLLYKQKLSLSLNTEKMKQSLLIIKNEYKNCLSPQIKKAFENVSQGKSKSIIQNSTFIGCLDPTIKRLLE